MPRPTLMEGFDSSLRVFIRVFPGVQPAWDSQLPLCTPYRQTPLHGPPPWLLCGPLPSTWASFLFPFKICWSLSVGSQEGLPL